MLAIVLLVIGDGLLWHQTKAKSDSQQAETAAVVSLKVRVPLMLSYDYKTLDSDLAVAVGNVTGPFKNEYRSLLETVVAPRAVKQEVVTSTRVVDAAVIGGNSSTVKVLAFLSQSSTSGKKAAQASGSRVIVKMMHTKDGWFVAGLEPV